MGGLVPLGYRVEDRALHIVEDHAEIVRSLFRRYLETGSVVRLKQQLDADDFRLPVRIDGGGRSTGGGLISRGHIYKILSNPIYVGRIAHKGQTHEGQQPPIVTQDLWNDVRQSLGDHLGAARTKRTRQSSDALLTGKFYDDSGNRMSPTWARKGSKRWRYYVSQAVLQGDKSKATTILRVPAADVEKLVAEAVGKHSSSDASPADIRNLIDRVVISHATIRIHLSEVAEERRREDFLASLDAAVALSQARDHPGSRRWEDLRPPDAHQRTRHPDQSSSRRPSLAGRTPVRSPPDFEVDRFARGQDCPVDPDDPVAGFPRAGDCQGGSRRTPAARLWPEASHRPANGLGGSVAHARTPGASAGVTNDPPLLVRLPATS
jgi:site-specific DNA recombinase